MVETGFVCFLSWGEGKMKIKMAKKAELCLFCVKFEVPLLSRVRYAAR